MTVWRCAGPLALALITACSVNHRSRDFTCTAQDDCSAGRFCIDGFCVAGTSLPSIDAAVAVDGNPGSVCPAQCTSCETDSKTCVINCAVAPSLCEQPLSCPTGWSCNIDCALSDSCRSGVDCTTAAACEITCSGLGSCRDIRCGPGRCDVDCSNFDTCEDVRCDPSCACDVTCSLGACDQLRCPVGCDSVLGCSSRRAGCDTCI